MRFKLVVQTISAAGKQGDTADLSPPIERAEAQRQLDSFIKGRNARPTPEGWMLQACNGTTYLVGLERCEPEAVRAPRLTGIFHQPQLS